MDTLEAVVEVAGPLIHGPKKDLEIPVRYTGVPYLAKGTSIPPPVQWQASCLRL